MLKNYFKIAWRNLMKSKVFSFINIFGLTTGITVCLMIFLFIINEFSFDNFHKNGDNIYRVMRSFDKNKSAAPWLSGPYAPALLNDFPGEIKKTIRIMPDNDLISYNNRPFNERKVYIVDSNFFTFFSFPLIKGNPATALSDPNSIVLTESAAKRIFGNEDPMGKTIDWTKDWKKTVTGIAKDVPVNSHLNFDEVVSMASIYTQPWFKVWINNNHYLYVQLDKQTSQAKVESRFPAFMQKYLGPTMKQLGNKFDLSLIPMKDVYFGSDSAFDFVKHGSKKVVYVFLSIAALILLIACINFMNL
jgi:putative ABC transport system permease protein